MAGEHHCQRQGSRRQPPHGQPVTPAHDVSPPFYSKPRSRAAGAQFKPAAAPNVSAMELSGQPTTLFPTHQGGPAHREVHDASRRAAGAGGAAARAAQCDRRLRAGLAKARCLGQRIHFAHSQSDRRFAGCARLPRARLGYRAPFASPGAARRPLRPRAYAVELRVLGHLVRRLSGRDHRPAAVDAAGGYIRQSRHRLGRARLCLQGYSAELDRRLLHSRSAGRSTAATRSRSATSRARCRRSRRARLWSRPTADGW